MHLRDLHLQRFRSFDESNVLFHPHLTALVGENNGGKSNIVDALRLLFQPANGRRELYCEESDIRRGSSEESFVLKATFDSLNPTEKGLLITAIPDPAKDQAVFGLTFDPLRRRDRPQYWAGKFEAEPETGSSDLIRHVYLPPLRDARRALASGNPTRIATLIRHFLDDSDQAQFKEKLKRFTEELRRNEQSQVLGDINKAVTTLLQDLTAGVRKQGAALGFSDTEELSDIARDLRFKLADAGLAPEELRHSGLGYANLLFMTTVMVELEKARQADLTLFLVEEPEAHLHPQLQMLVLDFLKEQAQKSAAKCVPAGQPYGRIQVIVTTHSPNLTAWVDVEHLVVMRTIKKDGDRRSSSAAVSVQNLSINKRNLCKISRYLDVTRSALVFGGRVLLLEGIAEALLMPAIAKRLFPKRETAASLDREDWKRFQGATIVTIDGVDFEPYLQLLLSESNAARIAERVVVVTDNDPKLTYDRKQKLEEKATGLGASSLLDVQVNAITLEQALFQPENEEILKAAFLDLHPNSEGKWNQRVAELPAPERPASFLGLFTEKSSPVRKGDYAQALAYRLDDKSADDIPRYLQKSEADIATAKEVYAAARTQFRSPEYLENAIRALVK
jgi:putative ATP-dependent endonuclease of OLD family